MYGVLSRRWVDGGCLTHAITLAADDPEARDAWFHDGFGMLVVDAIRPLDPVAAVTPTDVEIRQATLDDISLLLPLDRELSLYMAGGPSFLTPETEGREEEYRHWLAQPEDTLWLALHRGQAIAYMRSQPHPTTWPTSSGTRARSPSPAPT